MDQHQTRGRNHSPPLPAAEEEVRWWCSQYQWLIVVVLEVMWRRAVTAVGEWSDWLEQRLMKRVV